MKATLRALVSTKNLKDIGAYLHFGNTGKVVDAFIQTYTLEEYIASGGKIELRTIENIEDLAVAEITLGFDLPEETEEADDLCTVYDVHYTIGHNLDSARREE